jgi:hypothetical protein
MNPVGVSAEMDATFGCALGCNSSGLASTNLAGLSGDRGSGELLFRSVLFSATYGTAWPAKIKRQSHFV